MLSPSLGPIRSSPVALTCRSSASLYPQESAGQNARPEPRCGSSGRLVQANVLFEPLNSGRSIIRLIHLLSNGGRGRRVHDFEQPNARGMRTAGEVPHKVHEAV